ncbi:MAG TPA: DUF4870 domain-containing protein [Thermomicrobiales bacterium]
MSRESRAGRDRRRGQEIARRSVRVAGRGSERVLAAAAHGAIAFGFVGIGFLLSLVITGVIWLASKKSPYVREQSDRAGRYQIFVVLANILMIALWIIGFSLLIYLTNWQGWGNGGWQGWRQLDWRWLLIVLDGLALLITLPLIVAWFFGTIGYGVYAAIRALRGDDFHYPPPPWKRQRGQSGERLRWVD